MGALHFYPGQKRMVWVVKGKAVVTAEAWGGEEVPDGVKFGQMRPHRTTAGQYVIHSYAPYRTKTWAMARIRWGVPLKVEGAGDLKYVLYKTGTANRSWKRVDSLIPSATFKQLKIWYTMLYGDSGLYDPDRDGIPDRWIFNEFGPLAVRYFRDTNHNRVLDEGEHLMGELIHTVPINEAETARGLPIKYTISHGCVHVSPRDRDRFVHAGAFRKGTTFVVHPYQARIPIQAPRVQLPDPPPPPPKPGPPRQIRERTFLDFVVVDQDGTPLTGRRYKLELPDGSTETGTLGGDARIERREIDPGSARFTLLPEAPIPATIAAAPPPPPELEEPAPEEEQTEAAPEEEPEVAVADLEIPTLDQIDIKLVDVEGKPVAKQKVLVVLADGSAREETTDGDGAISIADVPSGEFVVSLVG